MRPIEIALASIVLAAGLPAQAPARPLPAAGDALVPEDVVGGRAMQQAAQAQPAAEGSEQTSASGAAAGAPDPTPDEPEPLASEPEAGAHSKASPTAEDVGGTAPTQGASAPSPRAPEIPRAILYSGQFLSGLALGVGLGAASFYGLAALAGCPHATGMACILETTFAIGGALVAYPLGVAIGVALVSLVAEHHGATAGAFIGSFIGGFIGVVVGVIPVVGLVAYPVIPLIGAIIGAEMGHTAWLASRGGGGGLEIVPVPGGLRVRF